MKVLGILFAYLILSNTYNPPELSSGGWTCRHGIYVAHPPKGNHADTRTPKEQPGAKLVGVPVHQDSGAEDDAQASDEDGVLCERGGVGHRQQPSARTEEEHQRHVRRDKSVAHVLRLEIRVHKLQGPRVQRGGRWRAAAGGSRSVR